MVHQGLETTCFRSFAFIINFIENSVVLSQIRRVLPDKEDPSTWKKYTKTSCNSCRATCCSMPIEIRWEDLLNLKLVTEDDLMQPLKKIIARLKKDKIITAYREETALFAFKQTDEGKCRYLVGNKCGVYKTRPLVCRAFPISMGWRHGFCPQLPIEKKK